MEEVSFAEKNHKSLEVLNVIFFSKINNTKINDAATKGRCDTNQENGLEAFDLNIPSRGPKETYYITLYVHI